MSGRRSQSVSRSPLAGEAELALQQRHQRRRAVADESGRDLGVEQPLRDRPDGVGQDVEVLLGGMGDGQGGEANSRGQGRRIEGQGSISTAARPGQLDEGEAGEVRPLPVELGVDGVTRLLTRTSMTSSSSAGGRPSGG